MGAAGWGITLWTAALPAWLGLVLIALGMLTVHLGITVLMARPAIREALRIVSRFGTGSGLPFARMREQP
jgi:hypothetical protein